MARRSFVVIGLGRFGSQVASDLTRYGDRVLGIDRDEQLVAAVAGRLTEAVIADARNEAALREAGVGSYDAAVIAIGSSLEASLLCYMNLQAIGLQDIVVKAFDDRHARILGKLGAPRIVMPEQQVGDHLAQRLHNPQVLEYMSLGGNQVIALVRCTPRLNGTQLDALKLSARYGLNGVGVLRGEQFVTCTPAAGTALRTGDRLLVQGSHDEVRAFAQSL
ncbi:MAG TPA: TrkA family potassium uptake protein [Gammaproteobacteria bacterium]|nr:TrkA family potassium uptake protein [Gammaproteobacteria bacterium]